MLCCMLAALAASPLLLWPRLRHAGWGSAGKVVPLAFVGAALAGATLLCLILFTAPGAAAFRHICSTAAWTGGTN